MCRAGYPVSRRAFYLGIVIFHISNRGCKNEIGVIFIIIHTYVGKTTGGYWQVLGGTGGYRWVLGRTGGYGWILVSTGGYSRVTGRYWWVLVGTGGYWRVLAGDVFGGPCRSH